MCTTTYWCLRESGAADPYHDPYIIHKHTPIVVPIFTQREQAARRRVWGFTCWWLTGNKGIYNPYTHTHTVCLIPVFPTNPQ